MDRSEQDRGSQAASAQQVMEQKERLIQTIMDSHYSLKDVQSTEYGERCAD